MIQNDQLTGKDNGMIGKHGYSLIEKRSSGRKPADLLGKRFGHMTVIEKTDERFNGNVVWLCKCDCGNVFPASTQRIVHKNLQNCFDEKCPYVDSNLPKNKMETHRDRTGGMDDLKGRKFGKLTVKEMTGLRMGRNLEWYCECECGRKVKVYAYPLIEGKTTMCKFCMREEKLIE